MRLLFTFLKRQFMRLVRNNHSSFFSLVSVYTCLIAFGLLARWPFALLLASCAVSGISSPDLWKLFSFILLSYYLRMYYLLRSLVSKTLLLLALTLHFLPLCLYPFRRDTVRPHLLFQITLIPFKPYRPINHQPISYVPIPLHPQPRVLRHFFNSLSTCCRQRWNLLVRSMFPFEFLPPNFGYPFLRRAQLYQLVTQRAFHHTHCLLLPL